MANESNPTWWNDNHTSAWTRVKDALERDWEQTKADFSKTKGHELNQNAADTVKQAVGSTPVPPANAPTPHTDTKHHGADWAASEPAVRFGHGAATHYEGHTAWDEGLEGKMKNDWDALKGGHAWDEAKDAVRRGWEAGRRKV